MSKVPPSDPSLFDFDEDAAAPPPAPPGRPPAGGGASGGSSAGGDDAVALHDAARSRYLNYALSVITARALPDVRDGLKPVQRRILYTISTTTSAMPTAGPQVLQAVGKDGKYHPHGDPPLRRPRAHGPDSMW